MKKITAWIMAAVLLLAAAGCQSQTAAGKPASPSASEGQKPIKIGVSLVNKTDEWMTTMFSEFEKQAKERGWELILQDGNNDNEQQLKQVENFITQECDIIILHAANAEGILPAVEKAQEAGVKLMTLDPPLDHEWCSSTVIWDNYESGLVLGDAAKKYIETELKDKETINLVMIDGTGFESLEKRDKAFLEKMDEVGNVNVISKQFGAGNRELSANIVENMIPKGVDIVYGVVDNHAWGAATALKTAGVEKAAVFSCGGYSEESFNALRENDQYYKGLIIVPPAEMVKTALDTAEKIVRGEPVEKLINTSFFYADNSSINQSIPVT